MESMDRRRTPTTVNRLLRGVLIAIDRVTSAGLAEKASGDRGDSDSHSM